MMTHVFSILFLSILLSLKEHGHARGEHLQPAGATRSGDIIIGGIFPIHEDVEKEQILSAPHVPKCVRFDRGAFSNALAMINMVENINQSPALTKLGVTLGYRIHDSCSDVTMALRATTDLSQGPAGCGEGRFNASHCDLPVMAVIGAANSEMTIAVARQLNLGLIPQISYASSASILSDKRRFPGFFRTVPSDLHQTSAMVRLLSDSGWNWVGVVSMDGDYGRSARENLVSQAFVEGICVAFEEVLPNSVTNSGIHEAVRRAANTIMRNPKVKVVVAFAKPEHMTLLFQKLNLLENRLRPNPGAADLGSSPRPGSGGRVWLASDIWSSSQIVLRDLKPESIGQVVGFTFKKGDLTSFHHYLKKLRETRGEMKGHNSFLEEFYSQPGGSRDPESLLKDVQASGVFSVEMAVKAVAQAVADVCGKRSNCSSPGTVQPWEVLGALRSTQFEQDGRNYRFNEYGDIDLGYDVTLWRSDGMVTVAEYHVSNNSFTYTSQSSRAQLTDLKNVVSKCVESCAPGTMVQTAKDQLHKCCYDCINCSENQYSNTTDSLACLTCDKDSEWSLNGSSVCTLKEKLFFCWKDGFAIVLLALAALGILLVFLVGALFLRQRHTPVVKAAGGPLCQVILLSLVGSFASVVLFVDEPSNLKCKVRQVLFGLSFTLCVSCILVKSLNILLAFQINPVVQQVLRRHYHPYVIIGGCLGLQLLTCLLWLLLQSPQHKSTPQPRFVLEECDEGSKVAFGMMLGYIALLALVCFICAFKGRKLPQKYNEAKFITFGMLLYLISWVIFVPVYITTSGTYLPAVEMVVILISSYGVLGSHFIPKCYVILFKKEHNTKDAFIQDIHEYSHRGVDSISETSTYEAKSASTPSSSSLPSSSSAPFCISLPSFLPQPTAPAARSQCPAVGKSGCRAPLERAAHQCQRTWNGLLKRSTSV